MQNDKNPDFVPVPVFPTFFTAKQNKNLFRTDQDDSDSKRSSPWASPSTSFDLDDDADVVDDDHDVIDDSSSSSDFWSDDDDDDVDDDRKKIPSFVIHGSEQVTATTG